MRTPTIGTVVFNPADPPADPKELQRYLRELNVVLSACITALAAGRLEKTHVEPTKRNAGDIRYADGTDWNPGTGEGIYFYNSAGSWVKLG
jgi:hypothetical protein